MAAHLPKAIQNMIVLADGVTVEVEGEDGSVVFQRPPDRAANEYLINRVMGKPTDKTEAEVNLSGGVQIYLPDRKTG